MGYLRLSDKDYVDIKDRTTGKTVPKHNGRLLRSARKHVWKLIDGEIYSNRLFVVGGIIEPWTYHIAHSAGTVSVEVEKITERLYRYRVASSEV
jgi:hypothetical protein